MIFTKEEIIKIEEGCKNSPLIKKMWEEINILNQDAGVVFYKSLIDATNALSEELNSIHTGKYSKLRILNSDGKVYKRVYQLLTNSKKIIEGLDRGKELVKPKAIRKVEGEEEEVPSEDSASFTDRMADKNKK